MPDFPLAQPATNSLGWDAAVNNNFAILSLTAAKAWVHFDTSTGAVVIRDSYNVASVTYNASGDYTVNFASPFANAYYVTVGSVRHNSGYAAGHAYVTLRRQTTSSQTATSARISVCYPATPSTPDEPEIGVCFFGRT